MSTHIQEMSTATLEGREELADGIHYQWNKYSCEEFDSYHDTFRVTLPLVLLP